MAASLYTMIVGNLTLPPFNLPPDLASSFAAFTPTGVTSAFVTVSASLILPGLSGTDPDYHPKEKAGFCGPRAEDGVTSATFVSSCIVLLCTTIAVVDHFWKGAPALVKWVALRVTFWGALLGCVVTVVCGTHKLHCGKRDKVLHAMSHFVLCVAGLQTAIWAWSIDIEHQYIITTP
nr:hypothetical protein B0A51_13988 [Rachicladosporium sp. CCFEE 5018]